MDDLDNLRRITEHLRMMREELAEEVARPMAIFGVDRSIGGDCTCEVQGVYDAATGIINIQDIIYDPRN